MYFFAQDWPFALQPSVEKNKQTKKQTTIKRFTVVLPYIKSLKKALDSGLHVLDYGFHVSGTWIPDFQ